LVVHALAARRAAIPHHVAADMGAPCLWMFPCWICHNLVTALHSVWLRLILLAACVLWPAGCSSLPHQQSGRSPPVAAGAAGQPAAGHVAKHVISGEWPTSPASLVSALNLATPHIMWPASKPYRHTQCIAASTSRCSMATTQCARWASTAALAAVVWTCLVHGA
jgi:hypothetical protein